MLKAIALGLAGGAGFQAWRNYPPEGPSSARMLALVMIVGVLAAFFGGLWHGRGNRGATAVAVARAEATAKATQSVNVAVLLDGNNFPRAGEGLVIPTEAVSWFNGERAHVEAGDVDGMDISELLEATEQTGVEP